MAKTDKLDDPTITKFDRPADAKAADAKVADPAPAVPWLDLFKLAFGASGDADTAEQQADLATKKLAARFNHGP